MIFLSAGLAGGPLAGSNISSTHFGQKDDVQEIKLNSFFAKPRGRHAASALQFRIG